MSAAYLLLVFIGIWIVGIGVYWLGLEVYFRLWDRHERKVLLRRLKAIDEEENV
jgi:hypothetical protein